MSSDAHGSAAEGADPWACTRRATRGPRPPPRWSTTRSTSPDSAGERRGYRCRVARPSCVVVYVGDHSTLVTTGTTAAISVCPRPPDVDGWRTLEPSAYGVS